MYYASSSTRLMADSAGAAEMRRCGGADSGADDYDRDGDDI